MLADGASGGRAVRGVEVLRARVDVSVDAGPFAHRQQGLSPLVEGRRVNVVAPPPRPGQREHRQARVHAVRPPGGGPRVAVLGPANGELRVVAPGAVGALAGQEQPDRRRHLAPAGRPRLLQVEEVVQQIRRAERVHPRRVNAADLPVQPGGRPLRRAAGPRGAVAVEPRTPEVERPRDQRRDGDAVRPHLRGRRPGPVPVLHREEVVDGRPDGPILVRRAVNLGGAPLDDGARIGGDGGRVLVHGHRLGPRQAGPGAGAPGPRRNRATTSRQAERAASGCPAWSRAQPRS